MNIGISGCGIAGTAAAAFLAEAGHDVTLFEQAPECRAIGAGILLQPSGQEVLDRLGLRETIEAQSAKLDGLDARLISGRQLVRLRYSQKKDEYGLGVHRGLLFSELLKLCQARNVEIRTGQTVVDHRETDQGGRFQLSNEIESDEFDFLIAADGSRSQLRASSGLPFTCLEYNYAALWATGPHHVIQDRLFQMVDGTERLLGLLPLGQNRASFFWGVRSDSVDALRASSFEDWKREVLAMCPDAADLLQKLTSFDDLIFATYRHVEMKRWHTGRLIFIGDAAHATSPHLGQGANLALEDAACFAEALQSTNDFLAACRQFEQQRRAKLNYYQWVTKLLTPYFQSGSSLRALARNAALPVLPKLPLVGAMMTSTLGGRRNGWFG